MEQEIAKKPRFSTITLITVSAFIVFELIFNLHDIAVVLQLSAIALLIASVKYIMDKEFFNIVSQITMVSPDFPELFNTGNTANIVAAIPDEYLKPFARNVMIRSLVRIINILFLIGVLYLIFKY